MKDKGHACRKSHTSISQGQTLHVIQEIAEETHLALDRVGEQPVEEEKPTLELRSEKALRGLQRRNGVGELKEL